MSLKRKKVLVNLGCGSNLVVGFTNVDNFYIPNGELPKGAYYVKADIVDLPFEKESVDYIIADQVLEHFAMKDVPKALHEMRRVLKKGGKAVIIVPDFRSAVEDWLGADTPGYYNPNIFHYYSEVIYGNQEHDGEYHKCPMTPAFLNYTLKMVGLGNNNMTMYTKDAQIPAFPGVRPSPPNARLRNAQIVVEITKE